MNSVALVVEEERSFCHSSVCVPYRQGLSCVGQSSSEPIQGLALRGETCPSRPKESAKRFAYRPRNIPPSSYSSIDGHEPHLEGWLCRRKAKAGVGQDSLINEALVPVTFSAPATIGNDLRPRTGVCWSLDRAFYFFFSHLCGRLTHGGDGGDGGTGSFARVEKESTRTSSHVGRFFSKQ